MTVSGRLFEGSRDSQGMACKVNSANTCAYLTSRAQRHRFSPGSQPWCSSGLALKRISLHGDTGTLVLTCVQKAKTRCFPTIAKQFTSCHYGRTHPHIRRIMIDLCFCLLGLSSLGCFRFGFPLCLCLWLRGRRRS